MFDIALYLPVEAKHFLLDPGRVFDPQQLLLDEPFLV